MNRIEAFRLYDRDIPEFPFIVDKYKDFFVIYDKSNPEIDREKNHLVLLIEAVTSLFPLPEDHVIIKQRKRKEDIADQYTKISDQGEFYAIRESQAEFYVNLHDYLDTGIFLDHRPMRQRIYKTAKGKRVLNLFCYTGTVSVFAALGGAKTVTSVDMSQTYLAWAQRNFRLNNVKLDQHSFICENALEYLTRQTSSLLNPIGKPSSEKYDIIFLDPPTFSNSKKMQNHFDVEKDQDFLVKLCTQLLSPEGVLYFSNNKRNFRLSDQIRQNYSLTDITKATIPLDFHDHKIHHCFEIKNL